MALTRAITLDFTGFFYEIKLDFDSLSPNPTVEDVTTKAIGMTGTYGGTLVKAIFSNRGFLSEVQVDHSSNPVTRQKDTAGSPKPSQPLPAGIYGFKDDPEGKTNRIAGLGVPFLIAFQYYIFRNDKLISGATGRSTQRTIVPARQSNTATQLEPNDIVRWKLVAIGGLPLLADNIYSGMPEDRRNRLKAEASANNMTLRELISGALDAK